MATVRTVARWRVLIGAAVMAAMAMPLIAVAGSEHAGADDAPNLGSFVFNPSPTPALTAQSLYSYSAVTNYNFFTQRVYHPDGRVEDVQDSPDPAMVPGGSLDDQGTLMMQLQTQPPPVPGELRRTVWLSLSKRQYQTNAWVWYP